MIAPVRVIASIPNAILGFLGRGFRAFSGLALSTRLLAMTLTFFATLTILLGAGSAALAAPDTTPAPDNAGTGTGTSTSAPVDSSGKPKMSGDDWDKLAQCESTGKWDTNTGNGYFGGFQFDSGTWDSNGGKEFAETADKATREEQIKVAQNVVKERGFSPWPNCTGKVGVSDETRSREPETIAAPGATPSGTETPKPSTTTAPKSEDKPATSTDSKTTPTGGTPPADIEGDAEAGRSGSPKAFLDRAKTTGDIRDAAKYLTFSRYYGSTMVPEPQSENLASSWGGGLLTSLAGLFFSIASLGVYLFGQIMIFTISMDLLKQGLFTADKIFWKTTTELLNFDGSVGANMMQGVTILVAVGVGLWIMSRFMPQLAGGKISSRGLVIAGIALLSVVVMGNAAAKNHMESSSGEKAPIASMMDTKDLVAPNNSSASDWATFSPGWAVQKGYEASHVVGGWLSDAVGLMTNSMFEGLGRSDGMCSTYVTGMHAVYKNTQASKDTQGADALLLSYDRLVGQLYYRTYMIAIGGSTVSANNSWCRIAEAQAGSSPGEQALIGRAAGLYSDAIGSGGLGVVDNKADHVVTPGTFGKPNEGGVTVPVGGGTMVTAEGEWTNSNTSDAVAGATKFFGPTLRNGAGAMAFRFYFGACQWDQGKAVALNPEWNSVRRAQDDEPITVDTCKGEVMSGKKDEGFGQEYEGDQHPTSRAWNFSTVSDAFIEEDKSVLDKVRDGVSRISTGLGLKSDGRDKIRSKFDDSYNAKGENPARTYYEAMSGDNPTTSLLMSLLSLLMVGAIFKFFVTMALGAVATAAMALVIMLLMVFLLILLLIPIKSVTSFVVNCLKTVVSATFVTTVIVVAFDMMFTIAGLFSAFAEVASSNPLGQALLIAAANILAAYCFVKLCQGLFNINLTNPAGGMAATMMAAAPLLQSMGKPALGPMDREFYNKYMGNRGGSDDGGDNSVSRNMKREHERKIESEQPLRVDKGRKSIQDRVDAGDGKTLGKTRGFAAGVAAAGGRAAGKGVALGAKATKKAPGATVNALRTGGRLGSALLSDINAGGNTRAFSEALSREGLRPSQLGARGRAALFRNMSPGDTRITDDELTNVAGAVSINEGNLARHQEGVEGSAEAAPGTPLTAPEEARSMASALSAEAASPMAGHQGGAYTQMQNMTPEVLERQAVQAINRQNSMVGNLPTEFTQRPSGLVVPVPGAAPVPSHEREMAMSAISHSAGLQPTTGPATGNGQVQANAAQARIIANQMNQPGFRDVVGRDSWDSYQSAASGIASNAASGGYDPRDRSRWSPEHAQAIDSFVDVCANRAVGPVADMQQGMQRSLAASGWREMTASASQAAADQARLRMEHDRYLQIVQDGMAQNHQG